MRGEGGEHGNTARKGPHRLPDVIKHTTIHLHILVIMQHFGTPIYGVFSPMLAMYNRYHFSGFFRRNGSVHLIATNCVGIWYWSNLILFFLQV